MNIFQIEYNVLQTLEFVHPCQVVNILNQIRQKTTIVSILHNNHVLFCFWVLCHSIKGKEWSMTYALSMISKLLNIQCQNTSMPWCIFGSINCSITTRFDLFNFIKVAIPHVFDCFVTLYKKPIQYCMYVVVEHQIIFPSRWILRNPNYPNIVGC